MYSAYQLTKSNIWPKCNENPFKGKDETEGTWNSKLSLMTFNCGWTLSLHGLIMGSLHRLPEVKIWPNLNALPSKGNRDMEGVQNSKLKLVTFDSDLDL